MSEMMPGDPHGEHASRDQDLPLLSRCRYRYNDNAKPSARSVGFPEVIPATSKVVETNHVKQ
jgi:hypothetical protein